MAFSILKPFISLFFVSLLLNGCQTSSIQESPPARYSSHVKSIQDIGYQADFSAKAEQLARQIKEIDDAVAVAIDKDIAVAIEVNGLNRFRLEQIKKKTSHRLDKKMPDPYTFHITTDKKLFQSLKKLQNELNRATQSGNQLKKTFDKINKDMHG